MNVEDTGPVIDPADGLRVAVEYNRRDNALHMRPLTAWLAEKVAAHDERVAAYEAEYGPLDEEPKR